MRLPTRLVGASLVLAVVLLGATSAAAQVNGSWNVDANGNYGDGVNWLGGNIPNAGGVATFGDAYGMSAARTVTMNISPTLSGITFDTNIFQYNLTGAGPITTGAGAFTLSGLKSNGDLFTFFGAGHQISTQITGTPTAFIKTGPGTINLTNATNNFTAPVDILGGRIATSVGDGALGNAANAVTLDNGAQLLPFTTTFTSTRSFTIGSGGGTINPFIGVTLNGTLSGTGKLTLIGTSAMALNNSGAGFTGAVQIEGTPLTLGANAGTTGSLGGTASLDVAGQLLLVNTATNNNDRIADGRVFTSRGSTLALTGNAGVGGTTEVMSQLQLASGASTVTVTSTTNGSTLRFSGATGLQRDNRSTVYFRGSNLGGTGAADSRIIFDNSPGTLLGAGGGLATTTISILPFAHGSNSATATTGTNLVTWDSVTQRIFVLGASNYTTLAAATLNDNVSSAGGAVTLGGQTINALRVGGTITGAATDVLTINSGVILTSATSTIGAPVNFGSAEGVLHAVSNLTMNGVISGSNGLTKGGQGTLTLGAANTYSGVTTLLGGQVTLTQDALASTDGPFGNSATAIVMSSNSTAAGNSTSNRIWASGNRTISRDISVLGGGATVVGLGTIGGAGNSLVINGNISVNNPNGSRNNAFVTFEGDPVATQGVTVNGVISGNGGIRDAFSSFVFLNGSNTFTGGTNIITGTYVTGNDAAFGTGVVAFTGLGFLNSASGSRAFANDFQFLNNPTFGGTDSITINGTVFLGGGSPRVIIANTTNGLVINGAVSAGSLIKAGTGNLTLSNTANSYTGSNIIRSGTLTLGGNALVGSGVLGTSPLNVMGDAGTVQLGDASTVAADNTALLVNGAFTVGRNIRVNNQNTAGTATLGGTNGAGTATYSGAVDLNRTTTRFTAAAGGTVNFTGLIGESTGVSGVSIIGNGTVMFSNATGNSYTGSTTVSAGSTLLLMNTSGSGTGVGAVTVSPGGTLGGTGRSGGAVNAAGGNITPGVSPGVLTVADLTVSNTTNFTFELGGGQPGTGPGFYDQLIVENTFNIDGNLTVNTFGGFNPSGGVFYIAARAAGGGNFVGLGEGATVNIDGGAFTGTITYLANWTGNQGTSTTTGGNDVAIIVSAVPEPASLAMMFGGLGGIGYLWRRRRNQAAVVLAKVEGYEQP